MTAGCLESQKTLNLGSKGTDGKFIMVVVVGAKSENWGPGGC